MRVALCLAPAALAVAACGPVPVQRAEEICLDRARTSRPVSGEAGMGMTTDGFRSRAKIRFNLGTATTGDPAAAYDRCVYDRSGQMPTRPLYARTDWKG